MQKWSFKFKFYMIAYGIRHVKNILWVFHHYFDRVEYLMIKFIIKKQNYKIINDAKIIKYYSNIDYNVYYHPAWSQIKN
jgi:hypothetical protein